MPSTLPSSFASAAAGNSNDPASGRPGARGDGPSHGEWVRRSNGATQTFRRSSAATTVTANTINTPTQSQQPRESSAQLNNPGYAATYVPPHLSGSRNGLSHDTRYTREQLLDLFKDQKEAGSLFEDLSDLWVGEADAAAANGAPPARWSRRDEYKFEDIPGLDVCWDRDGSLEPLALKEMSEEEREIFLTSVNSPLKAPNQSTAREGHQREGTTARKTSLSHGHGGPSTGGLMSPTSTRPAHRHREASDAYPFPREPLTSPPASSRFARDEPSSATPNTLHRRKTDLKEGGQDSPAEEREKDVSAGDTPSSSLIGSIKRASTLPLGASVNDPGSPWATSSPVTGTPTMGAFGQFGLSNPSATGSAEKKGGFVNTRGGSRFRDYMGKGTSAEHGATIREKSSRSSLGRVEEHEASLTASRGGDRSLDPPEEEYEGVAHSQDFSFGSAALGGQHEDLSNPQLQGEFGASFRQRLDESQRFAAFGSNPPGTRDMLEASRSQYFTNNPPMHQSEEPLSPTFTNPYASPPPHMSTMRDVGPDDAQFENIHLPGLGGFGPTGQDPMTSSFSSIDRGRPSLENQRQASSTIGSGRGFPTLGGLGGFSGLGTPGQWSTAANAGTPGRDKNSFLDAFNDRGFQQPPSAGLGGPFPFSPGAGPSGPGPIGRGSKLGSLFPPAMQEQMMRGQEQGYVSRPEDLLRQGAENISSPAAFGQLRDTESPFHQNRGKFDFLDENENLREQEPGFAEHGGIPLNQQYSSSQSQSTAHTSPHQAGLNQQSQQPESQPTSRRMPSSGALSASQPPAAQQKTMVMPDRIRWIYRDPQGNTQGPWSGLEMHDWYRAGFFSPELLVKKVEDPDYEPLAQLIRRIGNSREPFLVPQIGIPGPPTNHAGSGWPNTQTAPAPGNNVVQPPFAGSFPSFGTTLTAEQQNALERRKQEEQYLMARQKEHLAQQQILAKQMHMQGGHPMHSQQLHHHSSAHSLHSQPSFSSVASPSGFQASPNQGMSLPLQGAQGNMPEMFRSGAGAGAGPIGSGLEPLEHIREEDPRLQFANLEGSHTSMMPGSQMPLQSQLQDEDQLAMMMERAHLHKARQESEEEQQHAQFYESGDRLQQFHALQEQGMHDHLVESNFQGVSGNDVEYDDYQQEVYSEKDMNAEGEFAFEQEQEIDASQKLSLTEQVQKAQAVKHPSEPVQSPWAKIEQQPLAELPQPPKSNSPLPAPAARRSRGNVADNLAAESAVQTHSPPVETPSAASVAPWAREATESQKQPSLKEIQEAEARKAAKQEEIAAAARRAALEKELANQPVPAAPGLPTSANWASGETATTPTGAAVSAWAKPTGVKAGPPGGASQKKTLDQIMKEDEALARKKRAAATAATNANVASAVTSAAQALSSGKRYADLAGKAASPVSSGASGVGGAWTTVGAGGKPKTAQAVPATTAAAAAAAAPTIQRTTSNSAAVPSATRPKPVTTTSKSSLATAQQNAQEEFRKWAIAELRPDLNRDIKAEDFVSSLMSFPAEADIITEAVHTSSRTMDSRHFAEEFIRRRALAEKGKTDATVGPSTSQAAVAESAGAGGWSEVARKGGQSTAKTDDGAGNAFKIVSGKKKGTKK